MTLEAHIGIDGSNLREGGGVTHLIELLGAARPEEHGVRRVSVWSVPQTLELLPDRRWLEKLSTPALTKGRLSRTLWQHRYLEREARARGCNVLFLPGGSYSGRFRPFATMCRNMLPFDPREIRRYGFSEERLRLLLLKRVQAQTFRRADGLIFLTEFARRAVTSIVGSLQGATATIPHGVSSDFEVPVRTIRHVESCTVNDPLRLLYVSHASLYKHQWNLVEAVSRLRRSEGWSLQLDLVGPRSFRTAVRKINHQIRLHDPERNWANYHGSMTRSEVLSMLRVADVGVFASSCENMPNVLLEKMLAGLPIVCSDRGPMPELLGDAGVYFDPEDCNSIARGLRSLIGSTDMRQRLSERAQKRAASYTWDVCATKTFSFLSRISRKL